MKKTITSFLALLLLVPSFVNAQELTNRVSGYILLQVESLGEAWYVRPDDTNRYYMKDGATAYEMMRSFGLGITDFDLESIPAVDSTEVMKTAESVCDTNSFAKNQSGKILLQVQQHGEAWYVYPAKCLRIYMKDGEQAYEIMRFLGLGITNQDLKTIEPQLLAAPTLFSAPIPAPVSEIVIEPEPDPIPVSEPVPQPVIEPTPIAEPIVESVPEPEPAPTPARTDITITTDVATFIINNDTPGMDCTDTSPFQTGYGTYNGRCHFYGNIIAWQGADDSVGRSVLFETSKPLVVHGDVIIYGSHSKGNPIWLEVQGTYRCGTGENYYLKRCGT